MGFGFAWMVDVICGSISGHLGELQIMEIESVESLEEFFDLLRDAEDDDEVLHLLRSDKLVKRNQEVLRETNG